MKRFLLCLTIIIPVATALADHNALLPRPQEVQYGSGTLALQGLTIQFTSRPSSEDLFAAEQLASRLSAIGQTTVEIKQGNASARAIVLNRTGEGAVRRASFMACRPCCKWWRAQERRRCCRWRKSRIGQRWPIAG